MDDSQPVYDYTSTTGGGHYYNEDFRFTRIELRKNEKLGSGSYGVVCIAKCDELTCAAKLLFSVLFDTDTDTPVASPRSPRLQQAPVNAQRAHRMPLKRFEQECRFLSRLKHPNIIQYLGTYRDPDTKALVLLMELMDESLTHFLSRLSVSLPYYLQINISHDIAMAVAYLHSNNIIHRDLSSNNILLLHGGSRAKVSDFGMSTLATGPGGKSRTMCPGTPFYMPPEALNEPPKYSEKLDTFSYGVLLVQILTTLFPSPTDRFTTMEVQDPREPSSLIEAKIAVYELTRRKDHLDLIDKSHPLLKVAKECLKDVDSDRPSARDLCKRLERLKMSQRYREGIEERLDFGGVERKISEIRRECKQLLDLRIEEMQEKLDSAEERLQDKDQILRIRTNHLSKLERELSSKKKECESLELQIRRDVDLEEKERALEEVMENKERQIRRLQQQVDLHDETVQNLQLIIHRYEQDMAELQTQLTRESQRCSMLLQKLSARKPHEKSSEAAGDQDTSGEEDDYEDVVLPHAARRQNDTTKTSQEISLLRQEIASKDSLIRVLQDQLKRETTTTNSLSVGLKQGPKAPMKMYGGCTASIGGKAYFRPRDSSDIFEFSCSSGEWNTLLSCTSKSSTLVAIESMLTIIGGLNLTQCLSLRTSKWVPVYPPMPTGRYNSTAVVCGAYLIVAGGKGEDGKIISSVEAFNVRNQEWISCGNLPYAVYSASGTAMDENIYLLGGTSTNGPLRSVITCTLKSLISTGSRLSLSRQAKYNSLSSIWRKFPDLPFPCATSVSSHGRLFAVGGMDKHRAQNAIYMYDASKKLWECLLVMKIARTDCLVCTTDADARSKLVVVGGYTDNGLCDSVEIVSVQS